MYEADFLSAAASSNNNESNSYALRQRQVWGQAAFDNGFTFTGGQMWSLLTETKHGMDNRTEALPMTIDANYNVGFSWARQYGLRMVENFGNKVWLAFSVENPQATVTTHGNANNFLVGSAGPLAVCSIRPSVAAMQRAYAAPRQLLLQSVAGHYRQGGLRAGIRTLRNLRRLQPLPRSRLSLASSATAATACGAGLTGPQLRSAFNSSKNGGGFGANARWSFVNKHLDFGLHVFGGDGVGRYGAGGLADASVHGNGTLDLIKSYQGLGHPGVARPEARYLLQRGCRVCRPRHQDYDPLTRQVRSVTARPSSTTPAAIPRSDPRTAAGSSPVA